MPRKSKGKEDDPMAMDTSEIRNEDEEDDSDEEGGFRYDDIYIPPAPKPVCSFNTSGPRLIITHIENENFKSYAGRQVLGPFCKCFNSIVGPNGSGKSNVIDSMLFVFGYRASKIRSKKISVLLHNSANHQNINSCTVTVHFQQIIDKEGDDYEIVPNSEIVISRTAFKDNSSFYTLNGKRVGFKQVAKTLRTHGIDLDHNRFLILQGEVEQIAMMKPKGPNEHETGMLEYLEDIIGTSRYKEPLEKLNNRVEELNVERTEKLNRVKIVEKERDELEGPKNEAVRFLKTENEIAKLQNIMIQKKLKNNEIAIAEKEEEKKAIDDGMSSLKGQMKELQSKKDELIASEKNIQKEAGEIMQKKEALSNEFNKVNNKDVGLQAEMSQLNKNRKKTKELLADERKKLENLESLPEKNKKEIVVFKDKAKTLAAEQTKEEEALNKLMAEMRTETQGLQDKKEVLQTQLISLQKAVDEAKSQYDIAQSELDIYLSNEKKEQKQLEQIQNNFDTTNSTLEKRKKDLENLVQAIPDMEKQFQKAQEELLQVREEESRVTNELRSKRAKYEENVNAMSASRSRGKVLESLMKAKSTGELPGIFGRLGDLGAIDQKYDVAISTACGPLDNIVVDTVDTGKLCIAFLKRHDIGKATFIALDKQEHLRQYCNSKIKTPENVPRLFDLIQVKDEKVRTAFYYALRDTLVAHDLSQATRIAYGAQRYRVVTLEGHLIETSGTMSGGGRTVMRGRMGRSVLVNTSLTSEDTSLMEKQLSELASRSSQLQIRQGHLEEQISSLTPRINSMKMDKRKFAAEVQALTEQAPFLKEQLEAQKKKVKDVAPNPAKVKELTANRDKRKKELDKASEAADEIDVKVKALHKQIMDLTGGRMKSAQKKLDEVNKKIDKINQEITKLTVGITTSERNSKKSREKIANMEKEIEDAENRLHKMKDEKASFEKQAAEFLESINSLTTEFSAKEDNIISLKKEIEKLEKEENKFKAEKLEVDKKIEAVDKKIQDHKSIIPGLKRHLKNLKIHKIPGESISLELKTLTDEELEEVNMANVEYQISLQENKLTNKPNLGVIKEYLEKEEQYLQRVRELEEITTKRNDMRKIHEDVRKRRLNEFMEGYTTITTKLKQMYQMITLGGDAEFELVDTLDPFSEGVVLSVRPPQKSWKNISNLSGGEKTLSSLALVFALHYYKPSPLYVMDEIDAALDFKNVSIVAHYIKERTKNAQFIIISLRSNMFEQADLLVGIYKTHNCTKSVTINPNKYGIPNEEVNGDIEP